MNILALDLGLVNSLGVVRTTRRFFDTVTRNHRYLTAAINPDCLCPVAQSEKIDLVVMC